MACSVSSLMSIIRSLRLPLDVNYHTLKSINVSLFVEVCVPLLGVSVLVFPPIIECPSWFMISVCVCLLFHFINMIIFHNLTQTCSISSSPHHNPGLHLSTLWSYYYCQTRREKASPLSLCLATLPTISSKYFAMCSNVCNSTTIIFGHVQTINMFERNEWEL